MAHVILMPKAGQSMTEGRIVTWFKKEGDPVTRGEPLLEIETDKANLEVEALASGVLRRVFVREGDVCAVMAAVGVIGTPEEAIDFEQVLRQAAASASEPARPASPAPAPPPTAPSRPDAASAARPAAIAPSPTRVPAPDPALRVAGSKVAASPLARRLAAERRIDLASLGGTGPAGRILRRDVELASPPRAAAGSDGRPSVLPAPRPYPPPSARPAASVPFAGMRRAIAAALQSSKSTIPHFYATAAIDMGAALALKASLAAVGHKATVNDLVVRACVRALVDEPRVNCRVYPDRIEYPDQVSIGMAVGSDEGLVVPVILNAQDLDLVSLAAESRRIVELAQQGKLVGMGQGTFTVSNLGMLGVESFAAIINPPEGAILAVGAIVDEIVPAAGGFFPRPRLRVTLSADHRAIDGLVAARFLSRVRTLLESADL